MRHTIHRPIGLLAALALTFGMILPASANEPTELAPVHTRPGAVDQDVIELSNTWFVELQSPPAARGTPPGQLKREKDNFRASVRNKGLEYTERFAYSTLFNGLSITLGEGQLGMLREIPGVKAIWPVVTTQLDPIEQVSPDLATALAMTGADVAQSELGFTGEGVKVAIMDTGVDYDHADLGGDGVQRTNSSVFPTDRVTHGWDFVGDDFDANPNNPTYNPETTPDAYPDDCNGHGTHVAGIVGADGETLGVAPGVTFGAYRVFGCAGSTTAEIMLAAMERALADGMDILNMSIGSAFMTWPQYPTAAGADALVDAGMVVVASIGNSGANGVYSAGAPGVGNKVIGVASFDNSHVNALTFRTNPADTQMAYLQISNTTEAPTSGTTPEVVYIGRGCPVEAPAVTTPDAYLADPAGKVALVDRGACTFNGKYQRAIDAGAVAVVVANNATGLFSGGGVVDRGYPAVGISLADGNTLKSQISAGSTTLTWTSDRINAVNPSGGRASSFTSFGLTAELKLKPNIGAPGGLIRAPYPLENGGYAILSGTSMSSPHVAGGAALLLEARPGTSPEAVKTLFQNSADPVAFPTTTAFRDVVHRQGAGMIDIDDAILATATVSPSEISVGEGTGTTATLTVTNNGSSTVMYSVSHVRALSTFGSTNAPSFTTSGGSAAFSAPSLTLAPGASGTVDATISVADFTGFNLQYGGFIVLTPDNGGQPLRVPYAGLSGDYQAIEVLTDAGCSLPALFKLGGETTCDAGVDPIQDATRQDADGAVFTMKEGDIPYFLVHLEHQARSIDFTVLDAATGEPFTGKGRLKRNPTFASDDYLPRNSLATSFFAWVWDGTLTRSTPAGNVVSPVPDGSYQVQLRLLKALGDPANEDHWETWTSPAFTIDRP